MKLGKLLGAGRSFLGGNKGAKAYRENKHVYLPKFNADKNPFTPQKNTEPEVAPVMPPEPAAPQPKVQKPMKAAAMPASAAASLAKTQKMAAPSVLRPVRVARWTHKLNPFKFSEPVPPPMVNAVQTELSLESVKPIANDLADADIEVVPAKSRTVVAPDTSLIQTTRGAWNLSGERLVSSV